jgi:long-chain acyl-CoA synthetase
MSIINTNNTNINININTNTNTGINTEINTGINTDTNIDINTDTVKLDTGYKKVWLNNYPACVPAHLKYDVYTSLNHLLDTVYHQYQNRVAYTCMGTDLTYAQLDAQSKAIAAWLLAQGLKHGERVAIMLPNILQYPCVTAGILRAGMVCVNTNPLYTARELKHQLQDSGAKAIFVLDNFAHVLQTVLPETAIHTVVTTSLGDGLSWWKGLLVNLISLMLFHLKPCTSKPNT